VDLGQQDDVGVAGDTGVHGDPAGIAAHQLDDPDPLVGLGGGVQAIDGLGRDGYGGVEAQRGVGAQQIVVDGLWDAENRHASGAEATGDAERAVAPDGDQAWGLISGIGS
jgi:hypothetical protein